LDLFGVAASMAKIEAPTPAPAPPLSQFFDEKAYPGETAQTAVTVSILMQTARDVIEGAFIPIWVRGEITDFKAHRNGHWYFCLRDRGSQIKCVIWNRDQRSIPAPPDDGMQISALGRLTVYPTRGEMQFSITRLEAEGDGLHRKALEITRAKLEADGLLDPARKRQLPRHPRIIAVVTSLDGAALHDIIAVVRRRTSGVRIVAIPAAVQGENAREEICYALDQVNRWGKADIVIVGRGGGAHEDLSAFNDERVARAVAACRAPTISAVGHEIDISICDLVADHRAPTPSAAAEAATRTRAELQSELRDLASRMISATELLVRGGEQVAARLGRELSAGATAYVAHRHGSVKQLAARLHGLSPLATLARGYAIARDEKGATLNATAGFQPQMPFDLVVRDGIVSARVERVEKSA
jgi:exodeoxyribonuclease VII large subunit